MARVISAAERSSLIRLAASLPNGDEVRRAILSGLKTAECGCDGEEVPVSLSSPLSLRRDYGAKESKKASKWTTEFLGGTARLHKHFGIPLGTQIPFRQISSEITRLRNVEHRTDEQQSLLRALTLAMTLRGMDQTEGV